MLRYRKRQLQRYELVTARFSLYFTISEATKCMGGEDIGHRILF